MRTIRFGDCILRHKSQGIYGCQHGHQWVRARSGALIRTLDVAVETVAAEGRVCGEVHESQAATVSTVSLRAHIAPHLGGAR